MHILHAHRRPGGRIVNVEHLVAEGPHSGLQSFFQKPTCPVQIDFQAISDTFLVTLHADIRAITHLRPGGRVVNLEHLVAEGGMEGGIVGGRK